MAERNLRKTLNKKKKKQIHVIYRGDGGNKI